MLYFFLYFGKRKPRKKFVIFQETETVKNSYISGNGIIKPKIQKIKKIHTEKIHYISGNGNFL